MKCLRCNLVNPTSAIVCKRCQSPISQDTAQVSTNRLNIYQDSDFLVIPVMTPLPKRCYKCNSRNIVGTKMQIIEHIPALEEALNFAVGQLIPIPLPSLTPNKKVVELEICFCRRHRSSHRTLFKIGWGIMFFSFICFAAGIGLNDYGDFFIYFVIASVIAFCIGMIFLYIEHEREIVSRHRYNAPYFWIKGFGSEYLNAFPKLTRHL